MTTTYHLTIVDEEKGTLLDMLRCYVLDMESFNLNQERTTGDLTVAELDGCRKAKKLYENIKEQLFSQGD